MSYRPIKGGRARQTGENDRNEVIAGLFMMSEISYERGLQLPINRPLVRRLEGGLFRRIDNTFLPHYFSYIARTLQYNSYTGIFYVPTVAYLSGSSYYFPYDFYLVQMY